MIRDIYIIINCNNHVKITLMSFGGNIQEAFLYRLSLKMVLLGLWDSSVLLPPFRVSRGSRGIAERKSFHPEGPVSLQDVWVRINKLIRVLEPTHASRVLNNCRKIRLLLGKTSIDKSYPFLQMKMFCFLIITYFCKTQRSPLET